jgi:hypothetical protein
MRSVITAALLTLCSNSVLTGCAPPVRISKLPADKMLCAEMPEKPKLTPLDWDKVQSIDEAKALVFKREWNRDYNEALP